jgi:hypothetical protein
MRRVYGNMATQQRISISFSRDMDISQLKANMRPE